jgi:hypothetical protein
MYKRTAVISTFEQVARCLGDTIVSNAAEADTAAVSGGYAIASWPPLCYVMVTNGMFEFTTRRDGPTSD